MQRCALGFVACLLAVLVGIASILIADAAANCVMSKGTAITSINVGPTADRYGYYTTTWEWEPIYKCTSSYGINTTCPFCQSCNGMVWNAALNTWLTGFPTPPKSTSSLNCNTQGTFIFGPSQTALLTGSYNLQTVTWWLSNCNSVWSYSNNPFNVP